MAKLCDIVKISANKTSQNLRKLSVLRETEFELEREP